MASEISAEGFVVPVEVYLAFPGKTQRIDGVLVNLKTSMGPDHRGFILEAIAVGVKGAEPTRTVLATPSRTRTAEHRAARRARAKARRAAAAVHGDGGSAG